MRILWLKSDLLLPLDKGGKLRTWHLMRHLARQHMAVAVDAAPAFHAGAPAPLKTVPSVRAIKDPSVKGFPEGISDEEFAERVRIARDRDDLARIQPTVK